MGIRAALSWNKIKIADSGRQVNPVWWFFCCLVSILIPDCMLSKIGYQTRNGRDRFREKLGAISSYVLVNIIFSLVLGWVLMHPGNVQRTPVQLNGEWNFDGSPVVIRGEIYPAEKLGLEGDEFPFGSKDLVVDATFLDQERNDFCDEFWGAKGNGLYFPCLPFNLLNSTLFSRPETQPKINFCISTPEEILSRKSIVTTQYLAYTWQKIKEMEKWVSFRGQVLDLGRLQYTHHRLEATQASWFREIRRIFLGLETEQRDIDHLMHHHVTYEQRVAFEKCIVPMIRVGFLDDLPFQTWFTNSFLMCFIACALGWLFIGSYVLALQRASGKSFGEWLVVHWRGGMTLPISRSYFSSQFKRSIGPHLGDGHEIQSRLTRRDFDLLVLNKGSYPNTAQFDPSELNRGMHHLAQTEPDYEVVDNLDFEPLRTVLLIPGNGRTSARRLAATIRSAAESRFPATHKLVVVVLDGDAPPEILSLFCDLVVPRHATKGSAYLATSEAPYTHNKARVYAGYYQYANNDAFTAMPRPVSVTPSRATSRTFDAIQSKELQVPLIVICKEGSPEELGDPGQGMRGQRDSVQLMLSFFQRIFFNGPLCPLDFDLVTLIKAVTGVSAEYFSLLCTIAPGTKLKPTALMELIRPLALDRDVAAVSSPLTYRATHGLARVTRVALSFFSCWANPLAAMGSECLLLPRECTVYRLWAPPSFTNSFLDVESFGTSCQPITIHPNVLRSYARPAKKSMFSSFVEEWSEDGFLTHLLQRRLPRQRILLLSKSVCTVALPCSFRGLLRFACVTWLKHLFGLISRVLDFQAWWGVQLHCLFLLGLMLLPPTFVVVLATSTARLYQTKSHQALLYLSPLITTAGIPGFFILLLFIASLSQKRVSLVQRWCDLIVSLILLPIFSILIPFIALWSCDKIALKFYYSSTGPSFKFTKPNPVLSSIDINKTPASIPLSLPSPKLLSPLPPSIVFSDASCQRGFDWRFREELVQQPALPQNILDVLESHFEGSSVDLACLVPFRYCPDWNDMIVYFRPDLALLHNHSTAVMGRAYLPPMLSSNEPALLRPILQTAQRTHSIGSLFYLNTTPSRGNSSLFPRSTLPPSPSN